MQSGILPFKMLHKSYYLHPQIFDNAMRQPNFLFAEHTVIIYSFRLAIVLNFAAGHDCSSRQAGLPKRLDTWLQLPA